VDKLTREKGVAFDRARVIFEHQAKVIAYDRSGGWNNAAAVLERGTGSCSEYTFALVSLLRRAGIPARYVGALSERGDEASFDDVFHRWAEAYFPGYGWIPLDANAAHGQPPGERAALFGGRSNGHVVTTVGGGASEYLD
jgi:transglutaminase-like putative cysteine protease